MYEYKYIPASLNAGAVKGVTPKDQYIDLFQETLREQFYNSTDWWTVKEETVIGSRVYQDIDVRVTHLINAETGLKLGDDWKTLLFQDVNHPIALGKLYSFDESIWLTINTEVIKNLTGTCTIRRCNNTLRWIDEPTGVYYEEPCAIEYMVKEARDYITQGSPFPTPGGFLKIYAQSNDRTNKINENQRFLFGNPGHWTGYKVIGTGINDFKNERTYDNMSSQVLVLDLIANFVNEELDDIINGIADVNTNLYSITLSSGSISGSPAGTMPLDATVIYNGDSVERTLVWTSSNERIATVSTTGVVTFRAVGTCTITAGIENNPATATCTVVVSGSPEVNADIRIEPDKNYILESDSRIYSVYLYKNGVAQLDTFTITCSGNSVPAANYTFTVNDGNHFTVNNILRDLSSYLTVTCDSGDYTKSFRIYLRGAWQYDNA